MTLLLRLPVTPLCSLLPLFLTTDPFAALRSELGVWVSEGCGRECNTVGREGGVGGVVA